MTSVERANSCLKDAINNEEENNDLYAIKNYSFALGHFASFAINNDTILPDLKKEIQHQVKYCMTKLEKIISSQKSKDLEHSNNDTEATKYNIQIFLPKNKLRFDDLCGMETVKADLTQALITPIKRPKVYSRGPKPYKAFLLFGPPGTGKSSIAQAVMEEAGCANFFYLSAGDILAKYIGESEAKIRQLFEMARAKKPSIIFIDEIDAVASKRTEADNLRGAKTELFVQMNSLAGITDGLFFMASTNCPQHLDSALLRRFDKLIYVPLPEEEQRLEIFKKKLSDIKSDELSDNKFKALAAKTHGFSPSDIDKICNSAKNRSLKRLLEKNPVLKCSDAEGEDSTNACECCTPILLYDDVVQALKGTNPSVDPKEVEVVKKFAEEKGDGNVTRNRYPDPVEPITFLQEVFNLLFCW